MKHIPVRIHILSPVHIGCDESYEPTNFVIDGETNILHHFDPLDFIKSLEARNKVEFAKVCDRGNILEIYKFVKNSFNKNKIKTKPVPVVKGLTQHYINVLNRQKNDLDINQFNIFWWCVPIFFF